MVENYLSAFLSSQLLHCSTQPPSPPSPNTVPPNLPLIPATSQERTEKRVKHLGLWKVCEDKATPVLFSEPTETYTKAQKKHSMNGQQKVTASTGVVLGQGARRSGFSKGALTSLQV